MFWKYIANLQDEACNFIKKETLAQAFSCEFYEIFKNTYFEEHPWTTASEGILRNICLVYYVSHLIYNLIYLILAYGSLTTLWFRCQKKSTVICMSALRKSRSRNVITNFFDLRWLRLIRSNKDLLYMTSCMNLWTWLFFFILCYVKEFLWNLAHLYIYLNNM